MSKSLNTSPALQDSPASSPFMHGQHLQEGEPSVLTLPPGLTQAAPPLGPELEHSLKGKLSQKVGLSQRTKDFAQTGDPENPLSRPVSPWDGALGRAARGDQKLSHRVPGRTRPRGRILPASSRSRSHDPRQLDLMFCLPTEEAGPAFEEGSPSTLSPSLHGAPPAPAPSPKPVIEVPSHSPSRHKSASLPLAGRNACLVGEGTLPGATLGVTPGSRIQPATPRAGSSSSRPPRAWEVTGSRGPYRHVGSVGEPAAAPSREDLVPSASGFSLWHGVREALRSGRRNISLQLGTIFLPSVDLKDGGPEAILEPSLTSREFGDEATVEAEGPPIGWGEQLLTWSGVLLLIAVAGLAA
jgi:hypothetical protein